MEPSQIDAESVLKRRGSGISIALSQHQKAASKSTGMMDKVGFQDYEQWPGYMQAGYPILINPPNMPTVNFSKWHLLKTYNLYMISVSLRNSSIANAHVSLLATSTSHPHAKDAKKIDVCKCLITSIWEKNLNSKHKRRFILLYNFWPGTLFWWWLRRKTWRLCPWYVCAKFGKTWASATLLAVSKGKPF